MTKQVFRRAIAVAALTVGISSCGDLSTGAMSNTSKPTSATSAAMNDSTTSRTSGAGTSESDSSDADTSSPDSSSSSSAGEASDSSASSGAPTKAGSASAPDGTGAGTGSGESYPVVSVVDGDTIKVRINGKKETIRMIGLDTPETKKPHVAVQCYGKEASSHMQSLVQSKNVQLEVDPSQGERDKYGRLLRYVFVDGKTNVALSQIAGGYGREYTYDSDYAYQSQFQSAQVAAQAAKRGLWGPPCNGFHTNDQAAASASPAATSGAAASSSAAPSVSATPVAPSAAKANAAPTAAATSAPAASGACNIKGNISSNGRKIAHAPGSASYEKTKITPSKGERMFCSAAEAVAAGWTMAKD